VYLPPLEITTSAIQPAASSDTHVGSETIMVVEDEEAVRVVGTEVLRRLGYAVLEARDALEALRVIERHQDQIHLLVTDVMMPQMTGDELARRLRLNQPSLKVLYLTGFSDRLFKEKVTLWQDEAFLDKPCGIKGLMEAVALLLFGQFEAPQKSR
jgi:two-component system, cell cycle sensor histidine kinase and response regulator CckA